MADGAASEHDFDMIDQIFQHDIRTPDAAGLKFTDYDRFDGLKFTRPQILLLAQQRSDRQPFAQLLPGDFHAVVRLGL